MSSGPKQPGKRFSRGTPSRPRVDFPDSKSFNGFGQIRQGRPTECPFVDFPCKGPRSPDDQPVSCWKRRSGRAAVSASIRLIMQKPDAVIAQRFGKPFGFRHGCAIRRCPTALTRACKVSNSGGARVPFLHAKSQMDIGTVGTAQEARGGAPSTRLLDDLGLSFGHLPSRVKAASGTYPACVAIHQCAKLVRAKNHGPTG